jgi:hypothetical protein
MQIHGMAWIAFEIQISLDGYGQIGIENKGV